MVDVPLGRADRFPPVMPFRGRCGRVAAWSSSFACGRHAGGQRCRRRVGNEPAGPGADDGEPGPMGLGAQCRLPRPSPPDHPLPMPSQCPPQAQPFTIAPMMNRLSRPSRSRTGWATARDGTRLPRSTSRPWRRPRTGPRHPPPASPAPRRHSPAPALPAPPGDVTRLHSDDLGIYTYMDVAVVLGRAPGPRRPTSAALQSGAAHSVAPLLEACPPRPYLPK